MSGLGQSSSELRAAVLDRAAKIEHIAPGLVALIAVASTVFGCITFVALCMLRRRLQRLSAAYDRVLAQQGRNDPNARELKVVRVERGGDSSRDSQSASWSVTGGLPLLEPARDKLAQVSSPN